MASIDFISCNAEHSKIGPITAKYAEHLLIREKERAESRGQKVNLWTSENEMILEIDESEPGRRMTRHVVVNHKDNSTYARF